jgi:HAD superfamily hydrolase (TIGR01509 family)
MKIILVDAVNAFVSEEGKIDSDIYKMLEHYPHKKIILTGTNDAQMKKFGLDNMPYEVFTLKHDPEKTDPKYFEMMLKHFSLTPNDVIYFEHNADAVKSAQSVGINTYFYDNNKRDLAGLEEFLKVSLSNSI